MTYYPLNRLCIPEKFHIKLMLYHYVKTRTIARDTVVTMTSAFNSKDIISLFDRVLAEEYIPITIKAVGGQALLSCDFCGASLFTSSWVCGSSPDSKEVCARVDANTPPKRVCYLCYVEGRKCTCGQMNVQAFFDIDELLELRNSFASLITPSNETDIVPHILSTE